MKARELAAWVIAATCFWVIILTPPRQTQESHGHKTKVIDLGVYDEEANIFTLPDGRVIAAPITNETRL